MPTSACLIRELLQKSDLALMKKECHTYNLAMDTG